MYDIIVNRSFSITVELYVVVFRILDLVWSLQILLGKKL